MSCIATVYIVDKSLERNFLESKDERPRFLMKHAVDRIEFDYSGFYVSDYLFTYQKMTEDKFFTNLDDDCMTVSTRQAITILEFMKTNPIDRKELTQFWLLESPGDYEHLDDAIDTFIDVHRTITAWVGKISNDTFGVLYLSD